MFKTNNVVSQGILNFPMYYMHEHKISEELLLLSFFHKNISILDFISTRRHYRSLTNNILLG